MTLLGMVTACVGVGAASASPGYQQHKSLLCWQMAQGSSSLTFPVMTPFTEP